jgi:hypothetical protein
MVDQYVVPSSSSSVVQPFGGVVEGETIEGKHVTTMTETAAIS